MKNPGIGLEIYDKPATKVDIRYIEANKAEANKAEANKAEANKAFLPEEVEVRLDWEGRNVGFLANASEINTQKGTIQVWVWDIGREAILFAVPGEDINATGTRMWASREWLERMRVDETGS